MFLHIQKRIRDILREDPFFDPKAGNCVLLIEDKAGLEFLATLANARLGTVTVLIETADGQALTPSSQGNLKLRESVTLRIFESPLYNTSAATALSALDHALNILHEAPLDPDKPGGPRFHVQAHECVQSDAAMREHLLNIAVPTTLISRLNPNWRTPASSLSPLPLGEGAGG